MTMDSFADLSLNEEPEGKMIKKRRISWVVGIMLLIVACNNGDTTPPTLAITSPASGSPVSGTVTVQVSAVDDQSLSRVDLYARDKGSDAEGIFAGSAVEEPFVISWNTGNVPNGADLELVARGKDAGGNESSSPPTTVKTQNSGVPTLQLVTAFTIEPDPSVGAAGVGAVALPDISAAEVLPPTDVSLSSLQTSVTSDENLSTQQSPERDYILEWQWEPFAAGAYGYGVYLSTGDLAGPYDQQVRQAASAGSGAQKYSKAVAGAKAGDSFYGTITAITNSASAESGYGNADSATFLPPQSATSPAKDAQVAGGRPTFSWPATPGAVGYLYYLYDKNPWESDATLLFSNFPNSSSALSVTYPSDRAALPSGTYYWWVAGVSFDQNGKADGFTFSEARRLIVP